MTEEKSVEVRFTPEFNRNVRLLIKKYPHLRFDLDPILEQIRLGDFIGAQIPKTNYTVFKVRIKNSDIQKGKSSGYRLIYQVKTPTLVVLVTFYSKLDQASVSAPEIQRILKNFDDSSSIT
jgi:mRNA-degrading endonuclease RelE of RelBE toxin-antitoxin system